ncbi:GTP 3',8-cyclase MoaA [Candidatus Bathyarchaeota archaeon]|nr:GTP 3',8-cyclase MoaA [Candidatus Bathyarchaeota archaeon]
MALIDPFGRAVTSLRVSLTDKCNLSCLYCDREGIEASEGLMKADEVAEIVRIASKLGMTKIKLTGGEPLLRDDIVEVVRKVASNPFVEEVSMVTNGHLLDQRAKDLVKAGLRRINVNLPSLDPDVYRFITDGSLERVIEGLREAIRAGLSPVKLNMVVLKGVNDKAIPSMIEFCSSLGTALQLIELHNISSMGKSEFFEKYHVDISSFEEYLGSRAIKAERRWDLQNRPRYLLENGVQVELVKYSHNSYFCLRCPRLRVTSDGKLKPCLMRNDNLIDILTPLRNGASDDELVKIFEKAVSLRRPYFSFSQGL